MKKDSIDYEDGTSVPLDEDDVPELTDAFFKNAKKFSDLPKELQEGLKSLKKPGRPLKEHKKVSTTLRLDEEVIEAFRARGAGWQTEMNTALAEWARQHGLL